MKQIHDIIYQKQCDFTYECHGADSIPLKVDDQTMTRMNPLQSPLVTYCLRPRKLWRNVVVFCGISVKV